MKVVPVLGSPMCRKTLASAVWCDANWRNPSRILGDNGLTRQDGLPSRPAGRISSQAIVGEGAPNAVRDYLRTNLHRADKPPMLRNVPSGPLAPVPLTEARIS